MDWESQLRSLPSNSGVYLFKNENGKVLYVGKAKDIKKRVSSYFSRPSDTKTQAMLLKAKSFDFIITSSEIDAFLLEANLIKKYRPFYNIKFSDDKFYPYIQISKGEIPYILITHRKTIKNADYFGPYPNATSVKIVLKLIRRIFPFQSVAHHSKKPCLYHHINLCPCVVAFPDSLKTYKKNVSYIKSFLRGNHNILLKELEKERNIFSKQEEFERASILQKQIDSIIHITSEAFDPFEYTVDPEFANVRIKKELASLKNILQKYYPEILELSRIECYDISNISGTNATGSMVVLTNGDIDKSQYRRFKIRLKTTPDDFFMMQEVLARRVKREDWEMPNLIVIDGGKGQVSSAYEVMHALNLNIALIGLAKREEIIVVPVQTEKGLGFSEIKLPKSTPAVNLLRRIRDEAHRFALSYHRLLRKKAMIS